MKAKTLSLKSSWAKLLFYTGVLFAGQTLPADSYAQTTIFADTVLTSSEVDNPALAVDQNLNSFAEIRANSGLLLGIGAYSGYIEVRFPGTVPANKTSYVKVEMDDDILHSLLGGSIGDLLATTVGVALNGNQEFVVQVKNNGSTVLSGSSWLPFQFSGERLKIVVNRYAETFIAITPDQPYNSIRITNQLGSLIGLSTMKKFRVFGAYYVNGSVDCGVPSYTSYDATGLNLDLIQLAGAGANNIHLTVDQNMNSCSQLSLGVLSLPASIEQKVYFEGLSLPSDVFGVRFQINPQLALLNIGGQISFRAQNGAVTQYSETLTNLLNSAMTDSLVNGNIVTIYLQPGVPVDRIVLSYNSIIGLNVSQFINFQEVFKVGAAPVFQVAVSNDTICSGTSAQLVATALEPGMEIHWYSSATGPEIGISASGGVFTTPAFYNDTVLYCAAVRPGCTNQSLRAPVAINVIQSPQPSDIDPNLNPNGYCPGHTVVITPDSPLGNQFSWYLDNAATQPITNGMTVNGAVYSINANGELTITGLVPASSPLNVYLSVSDSATQCVNYPGNLGVATIVLNNEPAPTTANANQTFCVADSATIADLQVNEPSVHWYDAPGGGTLLAPTTPLVNGTSYYATTVGAFCESYDSLTINVVLNDVPAPTSSNTQQLFCIGDSSTVADIQVNEPVVHWYDASGNLVPPSTLLTNGSVYYATNVGVLCESSAQLAISITVDELQAPTTSNNAQVFCTVNNPTIEDLQVTPSNVSWYTVPSGGTMIPAGTPLVNGMTYYGAQAGTNCESVTRVAIAVSFENVPAPTSSSVIQTFCMSDSATVDDLAVNNPNVAWYDQPVNGTLIPPGTLLVNGTSYYAANVGTYCESTQRLMIYAVIEDVPAPTTSHTTQSFCLSDNATVSDLDVNQPNIHWYDASGNQLPGTTVLVNGMTYYAANVGTNCESAQQLAIAVVITGPNGATISGQTSGVCKGDTITYTTQAGMTNYNWTVTGGLVISGGTSSDQTVTVVWQNTGSFSLGISYQTLSGCNVSIAQSIPVTVIICGGEDLEITKTVSNNTPFVGEHITFTITVENHGTLPTTNVEVSEVMPSGFSYNSHNQTSGSYNPTNGLWTIPVLNAGTSAVLTIVVTVNPTGNYVNVATIVSGNPNDIDPINNTSSVEASPGCLNVYNEITPNGDGMNDNLTISCIENYPDNSVTIYNRYGNKIYEVSGYKNNWNGIANVSGVIGSGDAIPSGTYYYVLKINNPEFESVGWVYVQR
ncbi:gliding motility-associated C-terminal domain-containing protein [Fluviicola sp.]|uniref:Ig-like domain-containing protein n=1 Tax=Fluviicola sp. TaxID=1917219 RepID=UPI00260AFF5A|nr:gliding motility-associated C-terminal domain-containing protein [Fluviicola sp.]